MWHNIQGHDAVVEHFRATLAAGRLASTYLFVGPTGIGKYSFAIKLAQAMLCQNTDESALDPCGHCESCILALAGNHPDIHPIVKRPDKNRLLIEQFLGDDDHRRQVGLCHEIALKPMIGRRKIAIIDDADLLTIEAANSLLKTLEEPPPGVVLILIGTSASRQLTTIRSRSQIVRFAPLSPEVIVRLLLEQKTVESQQEAQRLAAQADGSLARAIELADRDLQEFRVALMKKLAKPQFDSVRTTEMVSEFVDAAGREAIARRTRLRQVIGVAIEFFRAEMRGAVGSPASEERSDTGTAVSLDAETAAACVERCLDSLTHVDRYANQSTLIGAWLDDLANLTDASVVTR